MAGLVELHNATVEFARSKEHFTRALDNVSLTIQPQQFVAIVGPSGSGKSTLLRTINGLQPLCRGQIFVDQVDVSVCGPRELRQLRCRIGMIFQSHQLVTRSTVRDNIMTGLFSDLPLYKILSQRFAPAKLDYLNDIVDELGLRNQLDKKIRQLSGGEQQRVAIARALVQKPVLLLADEPTASLDEGRARDILHRLRGLMETHQLTVIINLHDVNMAVEYADRIVALRGGQVAFDGPPDSFSTKERQGLFKV